MIGPRRLEHLEQCVRTIVAEQIPGDLIETGVWRGGAVILMRAVLADCGDTRTVWAADSFEGLPKPTHAADEDSPFWAVPQLAVPLEEVQDNLARYGMLDEQVRFLEGWFRDTLPGPVRQLALLRLDGDMYESTWDALAALYPKVSLGGFVIVDDYAIPACKQAVSDYRARHGITTPLERIDWSSVFWRVEPRSVGPRRR